MSRQLDPSAKVENQKAFCSKWGCSLAMLRVAKAKGSPGFHTGNRVGPPEDVIRFLFKMLSSANDLPAGFATWKEFGDMQVALTNEVKRKEAQKSVMETAEVKRQIGEGVGLMFSELDRRDREQPPALAGRSAVEISERMIADTKSIKKTLAGKFQEIAK